VFTCIVATVSSKTVAKWEPIKLLTVYSATSCTASLVNYSLLIWSRQKQVREYWIQSHKLDSSSRTIQTTCNTFLDVYRDRQDEPESYSLHRFLEWFKEKSTDKAVYNEQSALKSHGYSPQERKDRPYIVTHQTISPNQSDAHKQLYFFRQWRMDNF